MVGIGFTFEMGGHEQRVLSIKPAEFLKGISKVIVKASMGAYSDALSELPEISTSLGLKATPQKRVGALILRALERALVALVSEIIKEQDQVSPDIHAASFSGLSDSLSFEIDRHFFERPNSTALVDTLRPDVEPWLMAIGLRQRDTQNLLVRLPSVIVRALHDEWRSNASYYREVFETVSSPFVGAAIMEQEWARYQAFLISIGEEGVFDESFGLRQIYVSPRCFYFSKVKHGNNKQGFIPATRQSEEPIKVLRWALTEVESWINRGDREFALLTVAGGPGSGKSSLAKLVASNLALAGKRVLFVPLHQVDLELGISRAISEYFIQASHFTSDPLSLDVDETTIMILDGLDEIQMQGRAAQESAQSFIGDLIRYIDRRNTHACKLMCLITGRDLAVQSAEGALKLEGQVLHLASYKVSDDETASYDDRDNIVAIDQRDEWWRVYGELTGQDFSSGMPETLKVGELNEVTSQPLLNYLVALAYRRGMKLDEATNINSVYEDLLRAVYDRAWARHSHPSVKNVSYDAFARLLEEVALSVWHGAGRTTTLAEVESHCQQSKVGGLLPSFESGISSGVSSLLLAFYFRQKGRRDDGAKTFEFTHKTFAEYLTSLRLIRLIQQVSNQMAAHESDPDTGIDEAEASYRWMNICGQTALDSYLLDFVRRELLKHGGKRALELQQSLSNLLSATLKTGWPAQRFPKLGFLEQQSYARNAEESLLACLNACSLVSREITLLKWPSETSAGEMIKRLQGQRKGPSNRTIMSCLSFTNFNGQCLDMADLYRAEMHHSSFIGANLHYATLLEANLWRCTFSGAKLYGSNLSSAVLKEAMVPIDQLIRGGIGVVAGVILDEDDEPRLRPIPDQSRSRQVIDAVRRRGLIVVDESGSQINEKALLERLPGSNRRKRRKEENNRETKLSSDEVPVLD